MHRVVRSPKAIRHAWNHIVPCSRAHPFEGIKNSNKNITNNNNTPCSHLEWRRGGEKGQLRNNLRNTMVYGRVKDHVTYSIESFEPFAPSRNHIDQLHKLKNTDK